MIATPNNTAVTILVVSSGSLEICIGVVDVDMTEILALLRELFEDYPGVNEGNDRSSIISFKVAWKTEVEINVKVDKVVCSVAIL
jgi:hypothetical protein